MATDAVKASIHIAAPPERVFRYFTDPAAIVEWLGDYVLADATSGGTFEVNIRGTPVRGRYLEIEPPERLLLSWGHAGSELLPPGSSTVEILLRPEAGGTLVQLVHSGLPDELAASHLRGWTELLGLLAVAAG